MAPLLHGNLVRLWGGVWNEGADKLCIILELCPHGSLRTFLKKNVGTWGGCRHDLALGAAKGLVYLHRGLKEPLIHRDIKPENIMIGIDFIAKLADFGESRMFDHETSDGERDALTMTTVGTKLYCAPEIVMSEEYNESVDIFSFALVLLCLAVGDIEYIRTAALHCPFTLKYCLGNRPLIPASLLTFNPSIVELIKQMWTSNFRTRPAASEVLARLELCTHAKTDNQIANSRTDTIPSVVTSPPNPRDIEIDLLRRENERLTRELKNARSKI